MRIEFRQEMNRKYMAVIPETEESAMNTYLVRMLTENRIGGLLPCVRATIDNCTMLYYEMTGWITVEEYILNNPVTGDFLTALIRNLAGLMEDLSHYLIPGRCILSDRRAIFTDSGGRKFRFTVFPKEAEDFEDEMLRLSESLLSKLSHNNQNAAIIGYGFYQVCVSGRIGPAELRSILEIHNEQEGEENEALEKSLDHYAEYPGNEVRQKQKDRQKEKQKEKLTFRFLERLLQKLRRDPKKVYPKPSETEDEELFRMLYENKTDLASKEDADACGTVFVRQENLHSGGMTGVLTPVSPSEGESLHLTKEICVAGRAAKDSDVVIRNETVSRIHAKFSRKNGSYAVQDCQSTNGTSVNGRKLPKDSLVTLSDGDEVRLGTASFRFYRDYTEL